MHVIHIGMGKTGTSSLQSHVFPRLVQRGLIGAYNPRGLCHALDGAVNGYIGEESVLPLARAASARSGRDMLLSNETLIEWDPALWEPAADRLRRVFGHEAVIVITLRAPSDYLRSLYQQVIHAGKVRPPEAFFLPRSEYRALRRFLRPGELDAINIDDFDLERMVSHYTARFASVMIVPFEAIGSLRFLSMLWPAFELERASFAAQFAEAPRANTSYSALAMRLTLARERVLSALGLRSRSASDRQRDKALRHLRAETVTPGTAPVPSWHRLMSRVSRHGPKAPYALPQSVSLGVHHTANMAFYARICEAAEGQALWLRTGASVAEVTDRTSEARGAGAAPAGSDPALGVAPPATALGAPAPEAPAPQANAPQPTPQRCPAARSTSEVRHVCQ
ncbi:MAG: hypothetical protein AAGB05_12765 [Pseudomonadota bacterium]